MILKIRKLRLQDTITFKIDKENRHLFLILIKFVVFFIYNFLILQIKRFIIYRLAIYCQIL